MLTATLFTAAAAAALRQAAAQAAAGTAPEAGQVRLSARVDINGFATGALQVTVGGRFGAVCSQGFDNTDAAVACRQLGFVGGSVLMSLADDPFSEEFLSEEFREDLVAEVAAPFVLGGLGCTGSEQRLIDCPANRVIDSDEDNSYLDYGRVSGECEPVFVACGTLTDAADGDVRLAEREDSEDGNSASGILEVFSNGAWGRVCEDRSRFPREGQIDSTFTQQSAAVVCRQLGFMNAVKINEDRPPTYSAYIDDDTWRVPVVLAGARCSGTEENLADCPGVTLGTAGMPCDITDEVYIVCVNDMDAGNEGAVRLADGESGQDFEYGRLEVFSNGTWGTVCDRAGFTITSAEVACRSLNFEGGAPLRFFQPYVKQFKRSESQVLTGSLPVKLAEVRCTGTERSLLECPARTSGIEDCGFETPGRTDATVVACANSSVTGCPPAAEEEGSLRLRGGVGSACDSMQTGFLEIFHDGEWGRVSMRSGRLGADVACRQLGFPHGTLALGGTLRGSPEPFSQNDPNRPSSILWLSDVRCRGPEAKLVDCDLRRGFRRRSTSVNLAPDFLVCRQFAIGAAQENLTTPGAAEGDVRLADEVTTGPWVSGRLQVFLDGFWNQVCGLGFDGFDATVACRQLGYAGGTANTVRSAAPSETRVETVEFRGADGAFPEVGLTKVGCKGTEASILECGADDIIDGLTTRKCQENTDLGLFVSCVATPEEGEEGALRLVNGTSGDDFAAGVLEVFHAGAWGTVCDGRRMPNPRPFTQRNVVPDYAYVGISLAAADVVCQELGFLEGAFRQYDRADRTRPPWVGQLECTGSEEVFTQCDDFVFGDTQDCFDSQLRLACSNADVAAMDRLGEVRLVGGSADNATPPAWQYGLMEVHDGFIFGESCLDGQAAAVACRSLGFSTGAQLFSPAGGDQVLPGAQSEASRIEGIECAGTEDDLASCKITGEVNNFVRKFEIVSSRSLSGGAKSCAVACSTPTGCGASGPRAPAVQGDIRLVPVLTGARATSTCDEVHFGAVELFNNGQWGRVCAGAARGDLASFQLDAGVVCRQLGFPFATILPLTSSNADLPQLSATIAWATDVRCTGVEARLDECFFLVAGNATDSGLPAEPLTDEEASCVGTQANRFAVVCRMFEIKGSQYIR